MSVYRRPKQDSQDGANHSPTDILLYFVAFAYAMLPFIRLIVTGTADQLDLGVATILLVALGSAAWARRARPDAEGPREERS